MGTTTGFSVDTFDVDDAKGVSRHDTTLIQREAILALCFSLIHEAFGDVMCRVDQSVRRILDVILLLPCQTLEMRDVQMRLLLRLLSSSLPDVWAKNLSAGSKDEMCSRMMGLQLPSSTKIDCSVDSLSNDAIFG